MPDVSSKPWKAPSNVSVEQVFADNYELGSYLDQVQTVGKTEGQTKTETSTSDNWKITKFETTPLMSTYLVAFACGQFASLESEHHSKLTGKTVPLKIFATPDLIKHAQFGLDIKKWALPVYEEVFDIPYALPKLDTLVAHDFDAGAMENWGLITGRTTAYIYDPEKSSLAAKKRVATVQCHELAHMWFGDIVTMKWWDNLWLNEAFATLMGELVIPDRIWPEWKPRQEFVEGHLQSALDLDARRASHPIEVDCPDANQIAQIFDAISYSKGASVLRMLAGVVGEDKFLKGVSIYLKKHLYGNAETKDLWAGISEASGMDVAKFMANWTLKIGYPVITVEEKGDGKLKLTQNRFLASGDVKPEEDETLWWIPLEIKTTSGGKSTVDAKATLSERSATYDVGSTDEFKINSDSIGVYRVNYSPERLAKLGQQAANFSVEDRVGLVSDASSLARAGYGKTSGSLSLITALGKTETEYLPWSQIATAVGKIVQVWWEQPQEVRDAVDQIRIDLFKPIVGKLGYDHGADDAPDVKELRTLAVSSCASAGDKEVLAEIKRRFTPFLEKNDDSLIHGDIQRSVFVNSVKHGDKAEWNKIREVYSKPPNPSTKVDAIYSLCQTRNEECLDKTFDMMDDGSVKDQDLYLFFASFSGNPIARKRIGTYFMDNFDKVRPMYQSGTCADEVVDQEIHRRSGNDLSYVILLFF
jgi:aminopeptidase 2